MGHERRNNNTAGGDLRLPDLCAVTISIALSTQAFVSVSQQRMHLGKFRQAGRGNFKVHGCSFEVADFY
jgi:hypothetical protein